MTTRTAPKSPAPRTRPGPGGRSGPPLLVVVALVTLVVAALAAVAVTFSGGSGSGSGDDEATTGFDTSPAAVDGAALAPLVDGATDAAVGEPAPTVEGVDRGGDRVTVPTTGRPTLLLFLAHWCPHCQREVPALQGWIDEGELPDDVDVVGVATGIDDAKPNWPPSEWLDREGWTPSTVADADGSAAEAYGLTSFPYWVAVDADGTVVDRRSGGLPLDEVLEMTDAARAGR